MRRRRISPRQCRRKYRQKQIQRKKKDLTSILRFTTIMMEMELEMEKKEAMKKEMEKEQIEMKK